MRFEWGVFLQSFSVDDDDTGICVRRGVRLPSKDILRLCWEFIPRAHLTHSSPYSFDKLWIKMQTNKFLKNLSLIFPPTVLLFIINNDCSSIVYHPCLTMSWMRFYLLSNNVSYILFIHDPHFRRFNEIVMMKCSAPKSKFNLATHVSSGYLDAPTRLVVLITLQGTATLLPFLV